MFTPIGSLGITINGPGRRTVDGLLPDVEDGDSTAGTVYYRWEPDFTYDNGTPGKIGIMREVTSSKTITRTKTLATWATRTSGTLTWIPLHMPF